MNVKHPRHIIDALPLDDNQDMYKNYTWKLIMLKRNPAMKRQQQALNIIQFFFYYYYHLNIKALYDSLS